MNLSELELDEDPVASSWISDITLRNNRRDIVMTIANGKKYLVKNPGMRMFRAWIQSGSKGQFWHQNIKNKFLVTRLM